jgi:S-adenosylmethionine hydrolase
MRDPIITLLTDFGTKDHYVASMKGVILRINPQCTLIDITHGVRSQDIREGAFLLASACPYFPKGTIHISVVDPEVGGERRPILLETKNYFFIGPDNGLFTLAAKKDGIKQMVVLTRKKYFLPEVSATFHGRDIFAPVAGHLSLGLTPLTFGKRTEHWVDLDIGQPELKRNQLVGEVIHIDAFGNLITNIDREGFSQFIQDRPFLIRAGKRAIKGLKRGYWEGKKNEPIALFGSGGFLEIAVREGSAEKRLKLRRGDPIVVSLISDQLK